MSDFQKPGDGDETSRKADCLNPDEVVLQADVFGMNLKAVVRPRPDNSGEPESWTQVRRMVNKALMAIVTGFFYTLSDTLKACRGLVRGIGALPGALAERVSRAHERTDRIEECRQLDAWETEPLPPEDAVDQLMLVFERLQARGLAVGLRQLENGCWAIIAVRPELEDTAKEAAKQAMLEGPGVTLGSARTG